MRPNALLKKYRLVLANHSYMRHSARRGLSPCETHRMSQLSRWVSLLSTHPTKRAIWWASFALTTLYPLSVRRRSNGVDW